MSGRKWFFEIAVLLFLLFFGWLLFGQTVVVLVLAAGLAVKHMAYILINGNIFQELRTYWLTTSQEAPGAFKRKLFRKSYVLFSCNLCMTMHVAMFAIVLPTAVMVHFKHSHALEFYLRTSLPWFIEWPVTVFVAFLFAVVVAALAMLWWRVTEFPQEYTQAMVALREQELAIRRAALTSASGEGNLIAGITKDDVIFVLSELHTGCAPLSFCSTMLAMCARTMLPEIVHALAVKKGWTVRGEQELVKQLLETGVLDAYLTAMYAEYSSSSRYEKIRTSLALKFMGEKMPA